MVVVAVVVGFGSSRASLFVVSLVLAWCLFGACLVLVLCSFGLCALLVLFFVLCLLSAYLVLACYDAVACLSRMGWIPPATHNT